MDLYEARKRLEEASTHSICSYDDKNVQNKYRYVCTQAIQRVSMFKIIRTHICMH